MKLSSSLVQLLWLSAVMPVTGMALQDEHGQLAAVAASGNQIIGVMAIGVPSRPAFEGTQIVEVGVKQSEAPRIEPPLAVHARDISLASEQGKKEVIPVPPIEQPKGDASLELWVEPPMPERVLFPDAKGVIFAGRAGNKDAEAASIRNPWDIRVIQKTSLTEFKMVYGGLIVGDRTPIAFINGEAHTRGDRIGMFNLAEIRLKEAVLESNGTFYVLPEGRTVTVRVANSAAH